jgi:hypothetical protein
MMKRFKLIIPFMMVAICILGLFSPVRGQETEIAIEPRIIEIEVSSEFTIDIYLRNVPPGGIRAFQIGITWNAEQIEYVSHQAHFPAGWLESLDDAGVSDGTGYFSVAGAMLTGEPITEDSSLATITFHCIGVGSSPINIPDPYPFDGSTFPRLLIDIDLEEIPHTVLKGAVTQNVRPVGGIYAPTDKLSILTPYIALVGLIGAISTIFAIRKWCKD